MILGFDIGNTHIVPIFYNEDGHLEYRHIWNLPKILFL